nr:pentapeptide repeat-containing protein [Bradyrhizobium sp. SEMIA]
MKATVVLTALGVVLAAQAANAQDMMRDVDLTSPAMTSAEMSRAEVETMLAGASAAAPADFTGKRLSGLDLSGLNMSGAILRAARLNKTKLAGAHLDRAISIRPGCWRPISPAQASGREPVRYANGPCPTRRRRSDRRSHRR